MTHFRRHLATLAGQYGMLAGLLLLCAYYSIVTVRDQRPSVGDAARQIAGRAKSGSRAVIVAQSTEEDAVFVSALESEFKTRGVTVVAKAQGEPRDARLALESAAVGSPIACSATT